jgi:hypothetical protein
MRADKAAQPPCGLAVCYTHPRSRRGVAQPGSAPALGAGGRRFKSSRPDSEAGETAKQPCGCSSTVEPQPSKLVMGVRFPSPALEEGRFYPRLPALLLRA